jgi:hypothetical protein
MALDAVAKPHQFVASDRVEGTAVRRPNGDMIGHIELRRPALLARLLKSVFLTPGAETPDSFIFSPVLDRLPQPLADVECPR